MSFGSSTLGGSPEGIGGYESGIGDATGYGGYGQGLDPGDYKRTNYRTSPSYSQEAMAAALAAADQQMRDNNTEYGLSVEPEADWLSRSPEAVGDIMAAYTGGRPEVAEVVALQNLQNDYKTLEYGEREKARRAAEAVGMDTGYMGQANKETVWEKAGNALGSFAGNAAGAAFGPIGSTLGAHFGGKLGTHISGVRDDEEIQRAAGLLGPVVSPGTDLGGEGSDSLAKRILWLQKMGQRG